MRSRKRVSFEYSALRMLNERQKQKQEARDQDERDLASGAKSRDQLRRENGLFYGIKVVLRYDLAKKLF